MCPVSAKDIKCIVAWMYQFNAPDDKKYQNNEFFREMRWVNRIITQ
jgi:hypothetical protein